MITLRLGTAKMFCASCRRVTTFRVRRQDSVVLVTCPAFVVSATFESGVDVCLYRIEEPTRVAVAVARVRESTLARTRRTTS